MIYIFNKDEYTLYNLVCNNIKNIFYIIKLGILGIKLIYIILII
jgi:hypothetical protein